MDKNNNIYVKTGFALAAFCVILGAFASHVLKEMLSEADINIFDTATKYLFYHALGIIIISLNHRRFNANIIDTAVFLFLGGIVFFSGSLYLLATRSIWGDESYVWLGAITPLGGVMFIGGWFLLMAKGLKPTASSDSEKDNSPSEKRKHRKRRSSKSAEVNQVMANTN